MKMVTRIAFDNMKYHKSKNILTGIAVFLTTLLLFVVPTVGKDMIDSQFAMVNEVYPTWHALYRNVDSITAGQLAAHHDITVYGLRSDPGVLALEDASVSMLYLDEKGAELYKLTLEEGKLPQKEDEIVVSRGVLEALQEGAEKEIGDTITVPYQINRDGGMDLRQEREFTICGFLEDSPESREQKVFSVLVSEAFLKEEVPEEQIRYRFLFQVAVKKNIITTDIENIIKGIAEQFGIPEKDININTTYLAANYVDPVIVPTIVGIMIIIVIAGIITIYSIYYVSMAQRVQEFGKLKAIGATKRQVRQIVLWEGMLVALYAVPVGLIMGSICSQIILLKFVDIAGDQNQVMEVTRRIIVEHEIPLYHWWIYLLAAAVAFFTVYLSLTEPMRRAGKISAIEAMRYEGNMVKGKSRRKGYDFITIGRLTRNNLVGNKRKTIVTILSMSITGMFLMVISTVLSCANPVESANTSMLGQYLIVPKIAYGDKEHPELEWTQVQKNNPLNEKLKKKIERMEGVKRVDVFSEIDIGGDVFVEEGSGEDICGVPKEYAKEVLSGIIKGKASWEDLESGDYVIMDKAMLYWNPGLSLGDTITVTVHDGERDYEKKLKIIAIGDYRLGLTNYNYLLMAKEAADRLSSYCVNRYFYVIADKDYDEGLEAQLQKLMETDGQMEMQTWKSEYETWKAGIAMTEKACYIFLGILGAICIMNLINTMINSIHVRKKELGMMQAIGMSGRQLETMLQLEGLFYTLGTLILSVGLGSLLGYPVFLWAKSEGMFNISRYHYPLTAAIVIAVLLFLVQILLAMVLSRSVKKESLMERIRFSE